MNQKIYLDYNATTPVAEEVIAAMSQSQETPYGNPSSLHWAGLPARDAVESARSQVAALLCCDATEVVFTSGGSEANNLALKGLFFSRKHLGHPFHLITSQVEHPAILEPALFLEKLGAEITRLRVDGCGRVDPDDVRRAIRPQTHLITIMHANNEVGTLQPISDIAAIAQEHGILFHSDAAQSVGKISVEVEALGVDLLSIAGHKFYGPKGVGVLIVREGIHLEPLLHGAGHEAGRRAGTENIVQIMGLGQACELARSWVDNTSVLKLRDSFWQTLEDNFGDRVILNGHPNERLPNTLNVSFVGHRASQILGGMPNVAASTGSACHAGATQLSPVLEAMGVTPEIGLGAIRFSLGRDTSQLEIESVCRQLARVCAKKS